MIIKNLLILFLATISICSYGQSKVSELSNAEKFSTKSGTLIQREFFDIGSIRGAEIKIVKYTDLISGENVSSLRFEYEASGSYSTDTKIASLDSDEVKGLIQSIKIMQEKVFLSTPVNYTEVSFTSRGGFQAGCYQSKGSWETFMKLEKYDSKSYVFLKKDDFPELLVLLEKAMTMI